MFWGAVPPSCDVKKAVLETHGLDFRVTPQPAPYGVGAHFSPVADYAMECAPLRTGTQDTQETETGTGPIFATRDIVLAFVLCGTSVALGAQKDVDSKIKQPPRVLQPSSPGFGSSYDSVTVRCFFLYPRSHVHWYPLLVCLGFPSPAPPFPPPTLLPFSDRAALQCEDMTVPSMSCTDSPWPIPRLLSPSRSVLSKSSVHPCVACLKLRWLKGFWIMGFHDNRFRFQWQ
jgi:hypothetical protein